MVRLNPRARGRAGYTLLEVALAAGLLIVLVGGSYTAVNQAEQTWGSVVQRTYVQGKTRDSARSLIADALAVQEAGAFAVVLELVPAELAQAITERLSIPTVGIGSGPHTSAEIQVVTDVVGLTQGFVPRHARQFGQVGEELAKAVRAYRDAVSSGDFPSEDESSSMESSVLDEVLGRSALDQAASPMSIPLDRDL